MLGSLNIDWKHLKIPHRSSRKWSFLGGKPLLDFWEPWEVSQDDFRNPVDNYFKKCNNFLARSQPLPICSLVSIENSNHMGILTKHQPVCTIWAVFLFCNFHPKIWVNSAMAVELENDGLRMIARWVNWVVGGLVVYLLFATSQKTLKRLSWMGLNQWNWQLFSSSDVFCLQY